MGDSEIKLLAIIGGVSALLILAVIIIWRWQTMPKEKKELVETKLLTTFFNMFSSFPLTKKYTQKSFNRIKSLSVQTRAELKRDASKATIRGVFAAVAVAVGGMLIVSELICRLLMIVLGFMVANQLLAKHIQKLNLRVLTNLSGYIGLVREEFLRRGSIPDALEYAECPASLKISVDQIRDIMEAVDADHALNKFLEKTSCDYVKVFAIACVKINDMGEETEGTDEPTFIRVLKYIEEDVNAEIERRLYSRTKFGMLELVAVFPLFAVDLLPKILSGSMPGLNVVYEGVSGYIIKVLITLSGVAGYYIITMLSQVDGIEEDDRVAFIERLVKKPIFARIAESASPKKKHRVKTARLLRKSISRKSLRSLTLERILIALAAFIGTIIVGFAAGAVQKNYALKSTNTFGLIAADDTAAWDKEYILESDNKIIEDLTERSAGDPTIKAEELISDEELHETIEQAFGGLSELQIEDQITRVKTKYNLINSGYFHWFFVLIAYAVAVGAYFIPILVLKFRLWNIKKQEQEEFLSLQTLCTIIAISDADVLDALESLYKLAKLYKEPIKNAYLNYTMDPHKELERLSSKVESTDFKRMIKKLQLAVEDISLKEAFEGMEIERKHIVSLREQQARALVDSRREKAGMASKVSMALLIAGLLIFPVIYVGFTELIKVFDSLGQLN